MADSKITNLISGGNALATDEFPINRGGLDRKVTASAIQTPWLSDIDANGFDLNFTDSHGINWATGPFLSGGGGFAGYTYDGVTFGPTAFWQRTTTPLNDGDINNIGTFNFYGDNASGTQPGGLEYAAFQVDAPDTTAGSEDGKISLFVAEGGSAHTLRAAFSGAAVTGLAGWTDRVVFDLGQTGFPAMLIKNSASGNFGPALLWYQDSPSPAASDQIGTFTFYGNDSGGTARAYGAVNPFITAATAGSASGKLRFDVISGGSNLSLFALNGIGETNLDGFTDHVKINFGSTNFPSLLLTTTAGGGAGGPYIQNYLNSSSPAANDDLGGWYLYGNNNSAAAKLFAYMEGRPTSVTAAGEGGKWVFGVIEAGAHQEPLTIGGGQIALGATVHVEMPEISDPAAPGSNTARFYARDNGGGKTQLVVRFPTGAVQVIATEP